jgi:hypothetical protein
MIGWYFAFVTDLEFTPKSLGAREKNSCSVGVQSSFKKFSPSWKVVLPGEESFLQE